MGATGVAWRSFRSHKSHCLNDQAPVAHPLRTELGGSPPRSNHAPFRPRDIAVALEVGGDEVSLDETLRSLAGILFAGQSVQVTLDAIADLAQRTIPGCDAASVTVMEDRKPGATVSTAEMAEIIDGHQYATDTGPCLEATRSETVVRVDSFDDDQRWPAFVPAVLAQGVHSSLSLPLIADHGAVGALNLYSRATAGFVGAEAVAEVFASQAAITLANATAFARAADLAANLTLALEHRDVIGQAKGILIAQEGVSPNQAFDILRRASQRANRKVFDLAGEIVARNIKDGPAA